MKHEAGGLVNRNCPGSLKEEEEKKKKKWKKKNEKKRKEKEKKRKKKRKKFSSSSLNGSLQLEARHPKEGGKT